MPLVMKSLSQSIFLISNLIRVYITLKKFEHGVLNLKNKFRQKISSKIKFSLEHYNMEFANSQAELRANHSGCFMTRVT